MMSGIADIARLALVRCWRIETLHSDRLTKWERNSGRILGIAIAAIILLAAAREGALTYRENLASAFFYQTSFGPAVNFACNGKYNEIERNEEVERFLDGKSDSFDGCTGVEGVPHRTITGFESSMVYLELAAAAAWRVVEFNWESLFVIAAALTSGLALSCYGLLRVFLVSRLGSAALTYMVMSSAPVVAQIPHLRDFSKAPFLIGALACIAAAVLRPHRRRWILLLAAAAGALVAIGLGFRADLRAFLPIAVLSPFLLLGRDSMRPTAVRMSLVWLGFGAAYIALQLPLSLIGKAEGARAGTLIPHVLILGFAEHFLRDALSMPDAGYSAFRPYLDSFVVATVDLFGGASVDSPIAWGSIKYDQVSSDLLKSILFLIPYDTLLRVLYTANAVGRLPLNASIWGLPLLLATPILLLTRLRCFLFVILSFGILIAVLSLQYDPRHAFYMSLLGASFIALSGSALLDVLHPVPASGLLIPSLTGMQIGSLLLSAVLLVASLAGVSRLLAVSQQKALQKLVDTYAGLEWQAIRFGATRTGIEPEFISNNETPAFALKQSTESKDGLPRGAETFSRVTIKLQQPAEATVLPVEFSWNAVQEKVKLKDKKFTFSTDKNGYAVESNVISGIELSSLLAGTKYVGQKLWLSVKGETLRGAFQIGVLNHDQSKFAFVDQLPFGRWQYSRQVEITPDLSQFTVLFINHAGSRSGMRIESAEFVTLPSTSCGSPNAAVTADYRYVDQTMNLGGFSLPKQAGLVTYYFPQAYSKNLAFEALKLNGLPADCVTDWSVARNFPAGTPPAELLLVDGELGDFQRGDWASVWREFLN